MNGLNTSKAFVASSLIASAFAAVLLTVPASAGEMASVSGWKQSQITPASPYLSKAGRALNVGAGYQWRHVQDGQGKVYLQYRTPGGRSFTSLIYDPNEVDNDNND